MLTIAICDDDATLRKALKNTLERELIFNGYLYQITEFDSGESFLAQSPIACDILFLDIEMKRMNGMETALTLRKKDVQTVIIFVTSHPDYVFQGYEVRALNYILKPYQEKKITQVLHQALKEFNALKKQYYLINQKSGTAKVPFHHIFYFQSEKRQITAFTQAHAYTFYNKLDVITQELPSYFVRIHNRYIVNMHHISSLKTSSVTCQGQNLPVSRSYQQSVSIAFAKKMLR